MGGGGGESKSSKLQSLRKSCNKSGIRPSRVFPAILFHKIGEATLTGNQDFSERARNSFRSQD